MRQALKNRGLLTKIYQMKTYHLILLITYKMSLNLDTQKF